ncbi:MAG: hypothetical protein ACTHNK_17270 [Thermomicrobiales bacterium]
MVDMYQADRDELIRLVLAQRSRPLLSLPSEGLARRVISKD